MSNKTIIYSNGQVPSWYVIDKTYFGDSSKLDPSNDGVTLGRFVLLKYCETAFSTNEKTEIIENEGIWPSQDEPNEDAKEYYKCYKADNNIDKDQMIFQKVFRDNSLKYQEVAHTTVTLSNREEFNSGVGEKGTGTGAEIFNAYGDQIDDNNNLIINIAKGNYSHAEGYNTTAMGEFAHAEGNGVIALGNHTHSEGYGDDCLSDEKLQEWKQGLDGPTPGATVAEIKNTWIQGVEVNGDLKKFGMASYGPAHSEGENCLACGEASHAEGYNTMANYRSHAEGDNTYAASVGHAEGKQTTSLGDHSHAEGSSSIPIFQKTEKITIDNVDYYPSRWNVNTDNNGIFKVWEKQKFLLAKGNYSHAEGKDTLAIGSSSHSEGLITRSSGRCSHAEGNGTQAIEAASHAEGNSTVASGQYSHAEGNGTQATQHASHAEGYNTLASGAYSHAEGTENKAINMGSHVGGLQNTTSRNYQTVIGEYSIPSSNSLFTIGNGNKDRFIVYSYSPYNNDNKEHKLREEGVDYYFWDKTPAEYNEDGSFQKSRDYYKYESQKNNIFEVISSDYNEERKENTAFILRFKPHYRQIPLSEPYNEDKEYYIYNTNTKEYTYSNAINAKGTFGGYEETETINGIEYYSKIFEKEIINTFEMANNSDILINYKQNLQSLTEIIADLQLQIDNLQNEIKKITK